MLGNNALGVGCFGNKCPHWFHLGWVLNFGNTLLLGCDPTHPNKCCVPLPLWPIHMALVIAWVFVFVVVKKNQKYYYYYY